MASGTAMKYRLLGNSGLKVSVLSYGAWVTFENQVDIDKAYAIMKKAYEMGVNTFDNAETYAQGKAESIMGACIKRGIAEGVWRREDLVIITKIFFGADGANTANSKGLSRKHIVEGTKNSLARLGLDYVDVVLAHRPDPLTPVEEIVRAFNHLIEVKGQCFYWGGSEWSAQLVTEAVGTAERLGMVKPIADQPQYNIFERSRVEVDYLPLYKNYGYGLTIWSPLASGVLTGKYSGKALPEGSRLAHEKFEFLKKAKFAKEYQIEATDKLKPIADRLGCSLAQLAIAWCAKNSNVSTVILGATSVEQIEENLKSMDVLPKLTDEVMSSIEDIVATDPNKEFAPWCTVSITNQLSGCDRMATFPLLP